MLVIVVIAVVIIAYFAFYSGKSAGFEEAVANVGGPSLEDAVIGDSVVTASVKNKYVAAGGHGTVIHMVVFACDDGVEREFALQKEIFDALYADQRDTLIFSGAMFLGFGEYGGTDIGEDEADAVLHAESFSDEDFDESVDIEQTPDSQQARKDALSAEDKEACERFLNYEKLPKNLEFIEDDPDTFAGYKTENLLQKLTVYPFLKQEDSVARMFERVYSDAIDDMRGYDGNSRRGMAADDITLNGNGIRLVVTVQEAPLPLRCSVTAEFGVND